MLTRKEIFRGNLQLHLMLEQYIYGNLSQKQQAEIHALFGEHYRTPQDFHELVHSVRMNMSADDEADQTDEIIDLQHVQNVCQEITLNEMQRKISENPDIIESEEGRHEDEV